MDDVDWRWMRWRVESGRSEIRKLTEKLNDICVSDDLTVLLEECCKPGYHKPSALSLEISMDR